MSSEMRHSPQTNPGGVVMDLAFQTVDFFEGRFRIPTSLNPADWHPRAQIIEIVGDIEVPDWVIELAYDIGWDFNPHTKCFIKRGK